MLAGSWALMRYENTPGAVARTPDQWPVSTAIPRRPGETTLVLFAHPLCPCSRASMEELAQIVAQCRGRVTPHVLFLKPAGTDWTSTFLTQAAAEIPDVHVLLDEGGREARRFAAQTSGQVVLYDAQGKLIFSGGITASRGHSGDNAGQSAIVSLLNAGTAKRDRTLVFGCSLFTPAKTEQTPKSPAQPKCELTAKL